MAEDCRERPCSNSCGNGLDAVAARRPEGLLDGYWNDKACLAGPRLLRAYPLKRALDLCISVPLLILFSPVFLVIAALIKIDSRGPVFFRQNRCGLGGKEFTMFKFRTMVPDSEALKVYLKNEVDGPMFKVIGDPRVTRSGRYLRYKSLDELPQLVNIIRGEMSLVGPRPLAKEEMAENAAWMAVRLSVKPGLAGLWQIKGRDTHKFSDWVKYDSEYVENQSFLGDLKILLLTAPAVMRRKSVD